MAITASIIGSSFVTVMMDGVTHTINSDHANYLAIREALKAKDSAAVEKFINVAAAVTNFVAGRVKIVGEQVFYGDFEVKGSVVRRIIDMLREGFDPQPMVNFLDNLMANPSKRAVDELYGFLEATSLPITDDGHFLAYKKVRSDYMDFYTGKMNNSIGQVLEMLRNQVDENKDQTCSSGLHFCSLSYLSHYHGGNGRVMIVKINPKDVVAIPSDYGNAKGRAARYEIIGEHANEHSEYFTSPVYNGAAPASPKTTSTTTFKSDAYNAEDQYNRGYTSGGSKATFDTAQLNNYDDSAPAGSTPEFIEGFSEGYAESYDVDWSDNGYNEGYRSAKNGLPYNDVEMGVTGDFSADYKQGYADGWHAAKLEMI